MSKDETALGFDAGVRKAYDAMGPTQDARERVRARLEEEQRAYAKAKVSRPQRRAMIILPLAAGIAAIAAVLFVGVRSNTTSMQASPQQNAVAQKGDDKQVSASGATSQEVAAEEGFAMDAAESEDARYAKSPYQAVVLDNGQTYEVGLPVDADPASDSFEVAKALDKDGNAVVECTVAEGRYVRFSEGQTWYELVPST